MRIGSLFSGIGGIELGLEWSGVGHTVWQVEQDEYCRRVLERHWPDAQRFEDVCTVGATNLAPVDLICGGFPCQDISSAGKGAGLAGERSGLWFEFRRIVDEMRPRWVVVENVASGGSRWVDNITGQLGQLGYGSVPFPLSALDVGAPQSRKRVFIVARNSDRNSESTVTGNGQVAGVSSLAAYSPAWSTPPELRGVAARIPHRVDRLRAIGNSVVPQCAEVIGHIIREQGG